MVNIFKKIWVFGLFTIFWTATTQAQLIIVDDFEGSGWSPGEEYLGTKQFKLVYNQLQDPNYPNVVSCEYALATNKYSNVPTAENYELCPSDVNPKPTWGPGSMGEISVVTDPDDASNKVGKYIRSITSVESGDHFAYNFPTGTTLTNEEGILSFDLKIPGGYPIMDIHVVILQKGVGTKGVFEFKTTSGSNSGWVHFEEELTSKDYHNNDIPLSQIDQLLFHIDVYNKRTNLNLIPTDELLKTFYIDNIKIEAKSNCPTNIVVTNSNPQGNGSLFRAVICANSNPDHSIITFADNTVPYNIELLEMLPTIKEKVTINGSYLLNGVASKATVNGINLLDDTHGLEIHNYQVANSEVKNIRFENFKGVGLSVKSTSSIKINNVEIKNSKSDGIYIFRGSGTEIKGCTLTYNNIGINAFSSSYCNIGGGTEADGNIIQNNYGSGISLTQSVGFEIKGNTIGSTAKGDNNGNASHGIVLNDNVNSIIIGGRGAYEKNIIGENAGYGIISFKKDFFTSLNENQFSANSFVFNGQKPINNSGGIFPANGYSVIPEVLGAQYINEKYALINGSGAPGSVIELYKVDSKQINEAHLVSNLSISSLNKILVNRKGKWEIKVSDFKVGERNFYAATSTSDIIANRQIGSTTSEFSNVQPLCFNPINADFLLESSPYCAECVGAVRATVQGEETINNGTTTYDYKWYEVGVSLEKEKTTNFWGFEEFNTKEVETLTEIGEGSLLDSICKGDFRVIVNTGDDECAIENDFHLQDEEPYACKSCESSFAPVPGKTYMASVWVHEERPGNNYPETYDYPELRIIFYQGKEQFIKRLRVNKTSKMIDGWQKLEGTFRVPSVTQNGLNAPEMEIEFYNPSSNPYQVYFDDLRVHPYNSNMKGFVYDDSNLKLVSELDENNFATYYEYDEEGQMVRVKKETVRGVITISETRSNIKK